MYRREALAVVEYAADAGDFNAGVEAIDEAREFCEDAAGGVLVGKTAHHKRAPLVANLRIQCRVRVKGGGAVLGFAAVEPISLASVAVVGLQVEINDDLHLLERRRGVLLEYYNNNIQLF